MSTNTPRGLLLIYFTIRKVGVDLETIITYGLVGEQDGRGVGGCGVHLSPQVHQEYTCRRRSACRTPAESRQENLNSGEEYKEPHKTW